MTAHRQRLIVYVLGGALVCFVLWRLWQDQADLHALVDAERLDDQEEDALACVRAYDGREAIRDMAEKTYRRNAETLLVFAASTTPERVQAYEDQVDRDVVEVRAELPDPDCNLAYAQRVIKNQENP